MSKDTTHSALAVAVYVAAGFVIQFAFGNFDIHSLAAPVNYFAGGMIALLCVAAAAFGDGRFVRWFTGLPMSVSLIAALGVLSLVMGLTPQGATPAGGVAAVAARLGFNNMTASWPFVMVWLAFTLSLGCTVARRLTHFKPRDIGFLLTHAGLWIVFLVAGLGAADLERVMVKVDEGTATRMGTVSSSGAPRGLPFEVRLHDFTMEYYEPQSPGAQSVKPKRYASDIEINYPGGDRAVRTVIEVNHPLRLGEWNIYQYGFDRKAGPESTYTVVEMVRDRWLTPVYFGFALIALGALTMIWRGRKIFAVTALAAGLVYLLTHVLKSNAEPSTPVPALQSMWFVPHVATYIAAYAMLLAATLAAIWQLVLLHRRGSIDPKLAKTVDKLVFAGFGLLVIGMLMGAVWAKQAWGHYWEWDPKETWALVTTLAYLLYIHLRPMGTRWDKTAQWLLIVSFVALMITWQGVNYLPSAQSSIHVY
jgi:cytochrome c biogenesis factor